MGQKLKRVKRVQHLYERTYQTATGERRTKFYGIFTCKLKGKRRVFPLGGNLEAAKEELALKLADNVKGKDFDADDNTVARGMTLYPWTERFLQVKASKKSIDKDRTSIARLKAFFGDCAIDSIVTSTIEAYKQSRLGEVRAGKTPEPGTINRELSCLRTMLILAARDRILDRVPYIELFEERGQRDRTCSEDEFKALLEVSDSHLREILTCLWDTGMRKREALYLTWDRVDFKNGLIYLGALDTKGKYARQVPLSPRLKNLMSEIRQREKDGKVARLTNRVFLFRGKPIDRFDRAYETACKKAGVSGLWIHDLRASFATRKIDEGFDRDWVKMITGHKTDHVFKRYNRPSIEQLKKVVSGDQKCYTPVIQGRADETAKIAK